MIIDLLNAPGGKVNPALAFAEKIKKSKYKKIIILIDNTGSAAERLIYALKDDKVIYIGSNTNGLLEGIDPKQIVCKKDKFSLVLSTKDFIPYPTFSEGIGHCPDIWVGGLGGNSIIDIMKNIWRITKDYELVTSDLDVKIELNKIKK